MKPKPTIDDQRTKPEKRKRKKKKMTKGLLSYTLFIYFLMNWMVKVFLKFHLRRSPHPFHLQKEKTKNEGKKKKKGCQASPKKM